MLKVYSNGQDITENIQEGSVSITEQMNNRSNTCSFVIFDTPVAEGSAILVYETFEILETAVAGLYTVKVEDTYQFEQKWKIGDVVLVGSQQVRYTIESVDHTAKTITFSTSLLYDVGFGDFGKRVVFNGVSMKNPDGELGRCGKLEYKITVTDLTKIFDAKVVVDTYANMYSREMIGRIIYDFTAPDDKKDVDLFEIAWAEGGVARPMVADTTDRVQGTNSMKTGCTGAGTAIWTKSVSSVDVSSLDSIKLRHKTSSTYGDTVTSMSIFVGSDASNYYKRDSSFLGKANEDCRNMETFKFYAATIVGSPDSSAIDYLKIEVVCTGSIPSGGIHFDHMFSDKNGFSCNNTIRGDRKFIDVRALYKKPTVFVDDLSKLQGFFRYIDYEKDMHFFRNDTTPAPFEITDTTENFGQLSITTDISSVKNRQTVRGGIAPDQNLYDQVEVCDGKTESRRLDYPPKELKIYVDTTGTGSSYVEKTVGTENLVDPADYEYLFNFSEKVVRRSTDPILASGTLFKRSYYPYKPIRVRVQDTASIEAMKILLGGDGIFDGPVINDQSIRDRNEARTRARAEVNAYSNPQVSASFTTQQDGLKTGQLIRIQSAIRGIDNYFLIQKISKKQRFGDRWTYSISCGSTMFGITEFFQLLLKKTADLQVDVSEVVDIVVNDDETVTITPNFTISQKSSTTKACSVWKKWFDFSYETGVYSPNKTMINSNGENTMREILKSGTISGSVTFNDSTRYESGNSMKLTVASLSPGGYIIVRNSQRLQAKPSNQYNFKIWPEIVSALGGVGLYVKLIEYDAKEFGNNLQEHTIINGISSAIDFKATSYNFTTQSATNHIAIEIKITNTGTIYVGEILLDDLSIETSSNPCIASFSQAS